LIVAAPGPTSFVRADGSPARVDRCADVLGLGPVPSDDVPLVVQVSRWDELKDPIGVMHGFALLVEMGDAPDAHLLLAGPNVRAVADDPDGARVFGEVTAAFRALPHHVRRAVHLASLPTDDVDENAAIVNAVQRHAAIIVQKSLREGFGLTVTEAMWKGRPIVASAVGGIRDQIVHGVHGLLLDDPTDLAGFAGALRRILVDPALARSLGDAARTRAREQFLGLRSLLEYAALVERVAVSE
jgi:trehalose synthase